MIRIVFVLAAILVLAAGARTLWTALRRADIDWTGVTAAIGFVALAVWLRHVTGMG